MNVMRKRLRVLVPSLAVGLILSGCTFLPWLGEDLLSVSVQAADLAYSIVDTGQTETYGNAYATAKPGVDDPFYGQDAQIDGNQPSYLDNGDGTVTDQVTGLMWQQGYSGKMTYSEAVASVDDFSLAGYSDWRLPTIKELYSLIDFSGEDVNPQAGSANNPFIDTDYLKFAYGDTSAGERIIDSQWVTTTLYTGSTNFAGGAQLMFGVNFADGRIKGYPVGAASGLGGEEKTYFVRYVRGNTEYGQNEFVSNGDGGRAEDGAARAESGGTSIPLGGEGTVTDLATGLMWSKNDSGYGMNWEAALAYVQDLNDQNYLGYSDWYLPNAKELQSIVDYTRSPDATNSAAIDPVFSATSITNEDGERDWGHYWSSTTHVTAMGGQSAVYIAFGRGLGYMNGQFIDVHGAGCQRSDPKTGSASYGNGPQGDIRRVDNFVRVVRDESATGYSSNFDSSSNPSLGSTETPDSDLAFGSSETGEADFILFAPLGGQTAYLIDRDGAVLNEWSLAGKPGNSVYLLEGGNLLATYTIQGKFNAGGVGGGVQLLTWDGVEVWSYQLANDHAHLHHDVERLPNGNVLLISWEAFSRSEALAAGLTANQLPRSGEVWSEMILEYDPNLDQVVWEWHLWDHVLPEGWDAYDHPRKIDLDYFAKSNTSDWWHFNAIDYNENLDQIVISSRAASEFWILDHNLTTAEAAGDAGDLLYRYGNPEAYGASGVRILVEQHDAEFVFDESLAEGASPGVAGSSFGTANGVRILVFDNGNPRTRPYSRVVEIDLPAYGDSPQGVVLPAEIVWEYGAASGTQYFFADHISGAQRLGSGNTLICSGTEGRFFEVTPDNEIVWEYVNPYTSVKNGKESNEVFRCDAYSAAFLGQDLGEAAEIGPSSVAQDVPRNVGVGEPSPSGSSAPPANQGGQGIASVAPASLQANGVRKLMTITLDDRLAPPMQVPFSSTAIGDVQATSWSRLGLEIQAWFTVPTSTASGSYALTVTFPDRQGNPISFGFPIVIE